MYCICSRETQRNSIACRTGLELRHVDETVLRLMEQKDSNFARAIHHRREDPFYHKRKPFGYWNKLRLCAICWLFTNCRCHYACLPFEYLTKYLHGKKEKQWLSATNQAKTINSNQEFFSLSRKYHNFTALGWYHPWLNWHLGCVLFMGCWLRLDRQRLDKVFLARGKWAGHPWIWGIGEGKGALNFLQPH